MPNTEAAEIQVVLKDGNVMRVIGVAAEELWDGMMRADGEYLTTPTVTKPKPLRKVTEIHGSYSSLNDEIIDDDGCTLFGITLRDLMPEACTSRRAKIRITVESVEDVDR